MDGMGNIPNGFTVWDHIVWLIEIWIHRDNKPAKQGNTTPGRAGIAETRNRNKQGRNKQSPMDRLGSQCLVSGILANWRRPPFAKTDNGAWQDQYLCNDPQRFMQGVEIPYFKFHHQITQQGQANHQQGNRPVQQAGRQT